MKKHFFVVAAVIISSQLQAQKDTISTSLDEVVLTANKYPNKTSLTGKVVTIITSEQLERSGGKDLSQLLTEQAGLFISGANSNAGKDKSVYLRGAGVDHTLITIDGIPVYDPSGIGSNFDIRNLPLANIERIEILKGSQSTLYGSDAIAGVINIITKKSGAKLIAGNALLSYGSNETVRTNAGFNGRSGKIDYNAALSFHNTKGINETIDLNNIAPTDKDGFQQTGIQLGLGIRTSDKIYIQPFFRYSNIKGDIDQGAFTDELDYTYKQKSWQAGIRNEFSIGKSKLNILYNYNNINRLYTDDSIKSRNGYDTWSQGSYKGAEHFADAYIHIPLNSQVKLTGGVDYRSSVSDQSYSSVGFFGPYKTEYANDSLHQNQFGIYTAMNYNSTAGFNLELGSRVNFHSEFGSNTVFNINPSYFINKKVKLFANISSAYRTPSLYQLFSEYGNTNLNPEAGITTEAGLQYFSADNKFTSRAVAFNRKVKDVIFFYFNTSTFQSQYINQDKQKDNGFELETSYKTNKGTTIKAFYTYVTGEITTQKNGKDTTYNNLLRRPKSSIGINIGSQLCKSLYVSSNLMSIGKREDAYFDNNTFSTVEVTLTSYVLWDVYAEYGLLKNKLKVFTDLRNIAGSKYTEISGFNTLGFNGNGGIRFTF
ncbi:MAG: TonB-dependent receptor [Chitinophagaceae bacterium]|nr:TonB-dependent receptor [Chitinophagaceae bacterium]